MPVDGDVRSLQVVAGVLKDDRGRVLICQRPPGKHMAGSWEFPGGKRDAGESRVEALARELREELGLVLQQARPLIRYRHAYPDRRIDLDVWQVEQFAGEPRGLEGQAFQWVAADALDAASLLPADRPIINALQLGPLCAVTGRYENLADFDRRLRMVIRRGASLVQLRIPGASPDQLGSLADVAAGLCRESGVRLVLNGDPEVVLPLAEQCGADGIHLPARYWHQMQSQESFRTRGIRLVGVSCHVAGELEQAQRFGADYAVLGPVLATASHPGATVLGWERFATLVDAAALPVFAIGGLSPEMLGLAWQHGAQGVAAIRALWG
jgi:8-oxo-dGTP diphosphatase